MAIIKSVLLEEYHGFKLNITSTTVFETHSEQYDFD